MSDMAIDDDDFTVRSRSFLVWLTANGVTISPKIELADLRSRAAGRGVLAADDIAEDEELFSIPRAAILTNEGSSLPAAARLQDPWLSLILAMIYEYQAGDQSTWKPYLDLLPTSFDTPMFWTDQELRHLEGSALVDKIGKTSADEAFTTKVIPQIRQHAEVFGAGSLTDADLLRLCHRMGSTIMAYAFDLEKPDGQQEKSEEDGWEQDDEDSETLPKGMVPLADMLNADAERNNAKLYYEDEKVVMKSIKAIARREEIFNDYGPLPTADVLRRYGYTTSGYAQYDVVEISLDLVKQCARDQLRMSDAELTKRTAHLEDHGVLDASYDIALPSSEEGQFPEELCILLKTLTCSTADFEKLKRKDKLPAPELVEEAYKLLHTVLVRRRSMYSNDQTLPTEPRDTRQAMAYAVISGEKEVLRAAAEAVQEKLSPGKKRKVHNFETEATEHRQAAKRQKGSGRP